MCAQRTRSLVTTRNMPVPTHDEVMSWKEMLHCRGPVVTVGNTAGNELFTATHIAEPPPNADDVSPQRPLAGRSHVVGVSFFTRRSKMANVGMDAA